jgi:hypothetical protein
MVGLARGTSFDDGIISGSSNYSMEMRLMSLELITF